MLHSHWRRSVTSLATVAMTAALGAVVPAGVASAAPAQLSPQTQVVGDLWRSVRPILQYQGVQDESGFYQAPAGVDISKLKPGAVLKERTTSLHIATIETPVQVTQILHTTTNVLGEVEANVTSVIQPPVPSNGNVVAYQSFYDSANPQDNPSHTIAGSFTTGGLILSVEMPFIAQNLLLGHPVVVVDSQGAGANFAAGPGYGRATLDSLRAASASKSGVVKPTDKLALFGYSGGAIATNWALIQLDKYAPELKPRIVAAAQGGLFVNPEANLEYSGEGLIWSGVAGLALASLARAYRADLTPYLNDYGLKVVDDVQGLSIVETYGRYPSLRWRDIARPEYPTPASVPMLRKVMDDINMGRGAVPDVPMFIFQGAGGYFEGTPEHPVYGPGDGVMVTRDVRALVHKYCEAGTPVEYREYGLLGHFGTVFPWSLEGQAFMEARFQGAPVTNNCATVPPGNKL